YFDSGKATIKQESLHVLDDVAKVLLENPDIGRIQIQGHTDSRGGESYNMGLSQARTESVRTYLLGKNVPAARLDAVGYGLTRPIATNDTPEGREKNRRVEFVLIDNQDKSGPDAVAPAPK
ncbi:MAG TPA: OmpA family protein, partial [Myxococcota bacterium]